LKPQYTHFYFFQIVDHQTGDSLFRQRNFQKGGYWTERTEKDAKHQMFISLQLSGKSISAEEEQECY